MLTFKGDSFTNRVVASLYESIDSELKESRLDRQQKLHSFGEFLVVDSLRDFENVAVYLARKRIVLSAIKQELLYVATNKIGIFNTSRGVYEFMRSMQALSEFSPAAPHATLHQQFNKVPHIILTKSSKSF